MADAYRPDIHVIETDGGAVGKCFRSFAADLIETVSLPVEIIAILFNKPSFVEMGSSFAMIVDAAAVCKKRSIPTMSGTKGK
jgi:hypothetical protein